MTVKDLFDVDYYDFSYIFIYDIELEVRERYLYASDAINKYGDYKIVGWELAHEEDGYLELKVIKES